MCFHQSKGSALLYMIYRFPAMVEGQGAKQVPIAVIVFPGGHLLSVTVLCPTSHVTPGETDLKREKKK